MTRVFYEFIGLQSRFSRYATIIGILTIHFLALLLICYLRWQQLGTYGHRMQLYYRYSCNLRQGQMPYRDFSFAYPPLALLPIVLPHLIKLSRTVNLSE
jgi:hypothetical protein